MKKQTTILLVIFLFGFLVRLMPIDTSYFFWDETVYLLHAKFFVGQQVPYSELNVRPPFLSILLSPFYVLGMDAETWSRIMLAFANSFTVLLAYYFGREFNEKTAWISAVVVAFFPFHILASRWVLTDALAAIFSGLSVYFCLRSSKIRKTASRNPMQIKNQNKDLQSKTFLALSGFFFSLSILTKFTSILAISVILVLFYFYGVEWKVVGIKPTPYLISYFLLPAIITFLPYLAFNFSYFGNAFQPFIDAFHVVQENDKTSFQFTLFSLYDFFGLFLLLLVISILVLVFFLKKEQEKENSSRYKDQKIILFWSVLMIAYYVFILQRGVAKPAGIEWEAERFLLPAFLPVVIFVSNFLSSLKWKAAAAILIIAFLIQFPAYARAYFSPIGYEQGLRHATKEIALFAKDNAKTEKSAINHQNTVLYCKLNCPVLAYYSNMKVEYLFEEANLAKGNYFIDFVRLDFPKNQLSTNIAQKYNNLALLHSIKHDKWEAVLYETK